MASVDNSPWDGNRAMTECQTAADYNKICAGKVNGDPSLRASHKLPHHYLGKAPTPNAGGVRAALGRFSSTQGLQNRIEARRHLEAHMTTIQNQSASFTSGDLEVRLLDIPEWEIRHSGRPDEEFTVRGYAAVYNQLSHDLGGFREQIEPGGFDTVLATDPHVVFAWDHDTRYTGASTTGGTLELRSDAIGLHIDARVGKYSWAKDLRTALERGDVNQGSFKFTVGDGGDDWAVGEDGSVTRTIRTGGISGLYDVTVTAQGAYPQTSLAAARSLAAAQGSSGEPEAEPVAPEEGGQSSQKGDTDPEVARRMEDLKARVTLRRNELAELAERLGRL